MGDLNVTIQTEDGPVTFTYLQAIEMGRIINLLKAEGKQAIWHRNNCDCCVTVHEDSDEPVPGGWVVGRDGGSDYVTVGEGLNEEGTDGTDED
jgi:hypothetical protein